MGIAGLEGVPADVSLLTPRFRTQSSSEQAQVVVEPLGGLGAQSGDWPRLLG